MLSERVGETAWNKPSEKICVYLFCKLVLSNTIIYDCVMFITVCVCVCVYFLSKPTL